VIKCQHCAKQATIHITEIVKGTAHEFHLCEEHARQQLQSEEGPPAKTKASSKGQAAKSREASAMDQRTCPQCGITFLDFRNTGRLGCAHDYDVFGEELNSLLESIHGETKHRGKTPVRTPSDRGRFDELMQLRQSLKQAVAGEDYEAAARIRDRIRQVEQAK
jgi:protein arginine kinase activator